MILINYRLIDNDNLVCSVLSVDNLVIGWWVTGEFPLVILCGGGQKCPGKIVNQERVIICSGVFLQEHQDFFGFQTFSVGPPASQGIKKV